MFKEILVKSAIHHHDSKYASNWDLNIYRGCEHKCKYCFAQYTHKYMGNKDFFNDIFVKTNISNVLDKELSKKKWDNNNILCISGVCDCYQPAEKQYKLMEQVLQVLIKHKQSVFILTKSPLILRDYDLIKQLCGVASCVNVAVSIPTFNKNISKKLEPNVATPLERFNVLKEFAKVKNCRTTYMLLPIIPYLTDNANDMETIFKVVSENFIQNIIYGALNMRGEVKDNFYNFLKMEFPLTFQKIQKFYKGCYVVREYAVKLNSFCENLRKKYGIYDKEYVDKKLDEKFIKTQMNLF